MTYSRASHILPHQIDSLSRTSVFICSILPASCLGMSAICQRRQGRVNPRIRGEDVATMLMVHESGVNSICDCSYATSLEEELFPQTLLEIDGSRGTIRLSANYELTIHSDGVTEKHMVAPVLHDWASRPWHNIQESVYNIQQHWVACLASQRAPETSGQDNLKTMALVAAAYQSAAGNLASVDVKAVA